jgi:hypothetical protein
MSYLSSARRGSSIRSILATLGIVATVLAAAGPAAHAKTLLRDVWIGPGSAGNPEYKVVRGNDGVFRASGSLKVLVRAGGKINNPGNSHKIYDAYLVGQASGKPVLPHQSFERPSRAYKLLRSPTKSFSIGTRITLSKATLGNFTAAAEKRCKQRRSGELLPLKLTMVVDAGKHAAGHRANVYAVDRVRTVAGTSIKVRVRCHASHGAKKSTGTAKSGAKPKTRGSNR